MHNPYFIPLPALVMLLLPGCTGWPASDNQRGSSTTPASAIRRVVTGHDSSGNAIFLYDGQPERVVSIETLPGLELVELWATEHTPIVPVPSADPTLTMESFVPGSGGSRFRIFRLPGRSRHVFDAEAFRREYTSKAPGLAETLEEEDMAMHTTDTVDYLVILSGAVQLELDDGRTVELKSGDCIVQNGTRHAWRNVSRKPCVMAVIMIGATRTPSG
jgi:mannose-6-phosphate isomerase-like protein (cupin superfamily)